MHNAVEALGSATEEAKLWSPWSRYCHLFSQKISFLYWPRLSQYWSWRTPSDSRGSSVFLKMMYPPWIGNQWASLVQFSRKAVYMLLINRGTCTPYLQSNSTTSPSQCSYDNGAWGVSCKERGVQRPSWGKETFVPLPWGKPPPFWEICGRYFADTSLRNVRERELGSDRESQSHPILPLFCPPLPHPETPLFFLLLPIPYPAFTAEGSQVQQWHCCHLQQQHQNGH